MKSFLLVAALSVYGFMGAAQTLFTYGNNAVSKEEFLRAFNKNKPVGGDKEKSLREYLELYARFKLKVKAAKDMQMDTSRQFKTDLENFRSQIIENYMTNDEAMNQLVEEAIAHSQKDLRVVHFFAPIENKIAPDDSAKAQKAMEDIYSQLKSGASDYQKISLNASQKFAGIRQSDIGYITAFTLPYQYEKIIYDLKNGEVSKPYLSKNGWHIFKVVGERKATGKWKVAQILFALPPGETDANKIALRHLADSVHALLKAGADFSIMAKEYSNDKLTYMTGGEMPEFTTGKYDADFENNVFKLTKDGDLSPVFETAFGFHILKRISNEPIPSDKNNMTYKNEIKQKVLLDERVKIAKELFEKNVVKAANYKRNPAVKDAELFIYADSITNRPAAFETKVFPISKTVIYSNTSSKLTGNDWLYYIRQYKTNPQIYKGESNEALLEKFVVAKSRDYYKDHLEQFNPAFKNQMDEFNDGNLLFGVMEKKVWNNSNNDSAAIEKYYIQNKAKYSWGPSAETIIFNSSSKKSAEEAYEALHKNANWKSVAEEFRNNIQADSGRYELTQLSLPEGIKAKEGLITPVAENKTDGSASFIYILKLHTGNEQRSLNEARGLVINDYQNVVEEKWVEQLKLKYPVKVDEKVFQSIVNLK